MNYSNNFIAIPPGETIKEQLKIREMSQKEFSERMGISEKHASNLINGKVNLTQNIALKLYYVLGLPASFWNNLESIYREQLEKVKRDNSFQKDKELANKLPYAHCAKLGWVTPTRKIDEKVENLREFFHVASLGLVFSENVNENISFRQLAINEEANYASMMWIQKLKNVADQMSVSKINVEGLQKDLNNIRSLTCDDPKVFFNKLTNILAENGIKLILIDSLKGSFIHAATFIYRESIVLGITDRGKYADRFWFSLFHELGHIVLGHVFNPKINNTEIEKEADKFAQSALIPNDAYNHFIKKDDISRKSIIQFANDIEIDKGIVVGRLQNEGYLTFKQLNDLKTRYTINK